MKKVLLSLALALLCKQIGFSQGSPACPSVKTIAPNGGVLCQGSCMNLSTNVITNNQTTSYSVATIPYAPYPFTKMGTPVSVGTDDVWSTVVTLPFTFCYYGSSYTQCLVGSNGQITFDLTQAGGYDGWSITAAMPTVTDMPANTICGVFRDIDPALGGSVYYYMTGTSPCRAMVVCFDSVPLFDNNGISTSTCYGTPYSKFQMVLYENTNYIDIYVGNSFSCKSWNGGHGEIGIQNAGTNAVTAPNWNYPDSTAGVNLAYRFAPSGAPSYTVTWSGPGGVVGTGTTVNVCPTTSTTYTATMVLTNCNGSQFTVSDTARVTVVPSQTITVNSATICPSTSTTLTATGGSSYTWSPGVGLNTTSGATVVASPSSTTIYTVSGGGCAIPGTSTVTVVPACTITVNSATICPGQSTTLTASGGGPYSWAPSTGLSSTSGSSVVANPASTTVYTVTSVTAGFTTTATATVTVNKLPTLAATNTVICQGTTTTLVVTGASTYTWTPATGLNTTTASTVASSPSVTTAYTITGTAPNTCTNTTVVTVTVMPKPLVTITPLDTQGCAPLCLVLSGSSSTSMQNCAWNLGDGGSSVQCTPNHCFNVAGNYKISLTITDANGCSGTGTSTVIVHPAPKADFAAGPQPTSILDPRIQFYDHTAKAPITKWHWNFGAPGSADTSRLKNPVYTYGDTGSYLVTLVVKTAYGCRDSVSKWIYIEDDYELYVPTAFSPNNDGINDVFLPVASGIKESGYNLYIYDRWGNLVFHSIDPYKGWDGTQKNNEVLQDIYVWKILLKTTAGVAKQAHGNVTIIK